VFVRQDGPFVGRHPAEEAVGAGGTSFGSDGGEAVDELVKADLFGCEISFVADDQFLRGRSIAANGFVVADHEGFYDTADDSEGERRGFGDSFSHSPFHR